MYLRYFFRDGSPLTNGLSPQWNNMEPRDILRPRIFLCKSSRYLTHLNEQMNPDPDSPGVVRDENFGSSKFQQTCDPADDVDEEPNPDYDSEEEGSGGGAPDTGDITIADEGPAQDTEVIAIRGENLNGQTPIVVIAGLGEKPKGQSEEEHVYSFLREEGFDGPRGSVVRAFRLPFEDADVLVQMDSLENELKVVNKSKQLGKIRFEEHDITVREQNYNDLWLAIENLVPVTKIKLRQSCDSTLDCDGFPCVRGTCSFPKATKPMPIPDSGGNSDNAEDDFVSEDMDHENEFNEENGVESQNDSNVTQGDASSESQPIFNPVISAVEAEEEEEPRPDYDNNENDDELRSPNIGDIINAMVKR